MAMLNFHRFKLRKYKKTNLKATGFAGYIPDEGGNALHHKSLNFVLSGLEQGAELTIYFGVDEAKSIIESWQRLIEKYKL